MDIDNWIMGLGVGISSQTLWAAMKGIEPKEGMLLDIPYDSDDFKRCYDFIQMATPEQRKTAFENVIKIEPRWAPFVRDWNKLVALYEAERQTGKCHDLHKLMCKLREESDKIAVRW